MPSTKILCGLIQYNMLVHMVLIVRLLEIFLAHLVCAAVRGNPHIHARLGVGADLDALAFMVRGLVEAATSFAESRVNSFISYVDIFSITGIADSATSRLLAKTGGRTPRIVSERQYACYTEYVHIEGEFQ